MTGLTLRQFHARELASIPLFDDFISTLGGPCEIVFDGEDNTRTRVVVTLLHGNEPSGLRALFRLLKNPLSPATRVVFIVASVTAALTAPLFYYRMLPGQRDLNRCFSDPPKSMQGALATAIKDRISDYNPEAVIDVHNTSGSGPAFCVITQHKSEYVSLASHFCQRVIVTDIQLGSLMEQDFGCPIITFEAGGSQDNVADESAYEGIARFVTAQDVLIQQQNMEVLNRPRRLELRDDNHVAYSTENHPQVALTLRSDIECFNFGTTPTGTVLGWLNAPLEQVLKLDSLQGYLRDCFEAQEGQLLTRKPLHLFMVTTRADIAKSDCLFYFQHDFL